jgi:hypothetical protein
VLATSREPLALPARNATWSHRWGCRPTATIPRSSRLAGAAITSSGETQPDMEQRVETEFFVEARARIGIDAWDAAAGRGTAMTIDEAITYALKAARRATDHDS